MKETEIVALFLSRNETAITVVSVQYGAFCGTIANNILHNPQAAEECVNDTWLAAWNSIPPNQPNSLKAYLGRITRRFAVSRWRKEHTQKRGADEIALIFDELQVCAGEASLPDRIAEGRALSDSISCFLRSLPPDDRRLFVLRYWYCQSVAELAADVGCSESRITSRLFRIRRKLSRHLKQEEWL